MPPSVSSPVQPDWDVVVIGGGPAGSTAATTLAQAGRRVLVIEKEKFPRFHVGESLLPYNRRIFDELGVWPKLAAAGFMRKRGAQFLMGNGSHKVRIDFSQGSFNAYGEAIQVERAKFDHILLTHAQESGAQVWEESLVSKYDVRDRDVSIGCVRNGLEQTVTARFLIDASGLSNFTANRESLRHYYEGHKKVAIFGHFGGVAMPQGKEEGDILVVRRKNSWFWLIPLDKDRTSVGLVLDRTDFQALGQSPAEVHRRAVEDTPAVHALFAHAEARNQLSVITDFSYRNDQLVAPRLIRVGDASGFIDPIFSSGVMLAMTSGQQGAREADKALAEGVAMTPSLRQYEKENRRRIAQYWEFIENFYRPHFAQIFFQPHNAFRMVCAINHVLAGSTRLSFSAWWRLRAFFALARLNRLMPVVPRIAIG